jgi:hypothetical protein
MRWIKRFESFDIGKVLVIDNSKPPEKKYLENSHEMNLKQK